MARKPPDEPARPRATVKLDRDTKTRLAIWSALQHMTEIDMLTSLVETALDRAGAPKLKAVEATVTKKR